MTGKVSLVAQPLKINDPMPDLRVGNLINYPDSVLSFSSLKGKLVILDFWSTRCSGCIAGFPYLDSMQRVFKDEVMIILVNQQSRDSTERFFKKRRRIPHPSMAMITGDTILQEKFPHEAVPMQVWIDRNGILLHISESAELTEKNITSILAGKKLNLRPYDGRPQYVSTLFDKQWEDEVKYCSVLSRYIPGVAIGHDMPKNVAHLEYRGYSISDLFIAAFSENEKWRWDWPGRMLVKAKDPSKYIKPADKNIRMDWMLENAYMYQLILPIEKKAELYSIMRQDLARAFPIDARVEKTWVDGLALIRTSKHDKLRSHGGKPNDNFRFSWVYKARKDSVRCLLNKPFKVLTDRLENWTANDLKMVFVDETNYEGNIDIRVNGEILDEFTIDGLNMEFAKYDLKLVRKKCLVPVLVLSERL
jgi:thiol-disulfide isomerase/thioredoxin